MVNSERGVGRGIVGFASEDLFGRCGAMVWFWVGGVYLAMSLVTLVAYGVDKRRAVKGRGRIRESTLHWMEFLGGWPGAAAGQIVFRHKLRKVGYMVVFVGIVVVHVVGWVMWWRMGTG